MWAEPGLDHRKGILAGPIRYRILYRRNRNDNWKEAVDCSANDRDMLIDYRVFEPLRARFLKLEITGSPAGVNPGVLEFTAFGKSF